MRDPVRSRTLLLAPALFALLAAAASAGETISENRQIGDFSGIEVSGGYTIRLSQDSTVSLRLEGDKDDLAKIVTKVVDNKLVIKHKPGIRLFSFDRDDVTVHLGFRDIETIKLSGANKLTGQEPLRFRDLKIGISGSGEVLMDVDAAAIATEVSGSGEIELKGKADILAADVSGSGDIKCLGLKVKKAALEISGAGEARLDVSDELSVDISGSGEVTYRGNPAKVDQHVSGSGAIKKIIE
ncbi:MAG: DUF2807 domain-containing protein [Candidatus Edwardsbacteria bacterium]|jgi:hypothetical protein|nr:DUF2807 domain-containing protein [Candidatus Edwardsbacteria bacterium]